MSSTIPDHLATTLDEPLARLVAFEPTTFPVLSVYLNTQPDQHGRTPEPLPYLHRECKALARTWEPSSPERHSFDRDVERIVAYAADKIVIALILPAVFDYNERRLSRARNTGTLDENLSICVSVVLILVYAANLVYTHMTRRDVFASLKSSEPSTWPLRKCLAILSGTALIAVEANLIPSSLQATADSLALSPLFLGVIVLAIIGNAAEIIAATYFARQNRMDLVMGLCLGSSVQVALLAPALVLISHFLGHPMNLIFSNPLELIAIVGMVFVVNSIAADGETTWFEGVLLVAVYALLAIAFYFATP